MTRVGLAGAGGDGCDTAEVRPRGFVADPCGVVTGRDQQDRSGIDTDPVDLEQLRRGRSHEPLELTIERSDLGVGGLHAASKRDDRGLGGMTDRVVARPRSKGSGSAHQRFGGQSCELDTQVVRCGEHEMTELACGPDPDRPRRAFRDQQRTEPLNGPRAALRVTTTHDPTMPPARLRSRRARPTCHYDAVLGGSGDQPRSPPPPTRQGGVPGLRHRCRSLPPRLARASRRSQATPTTRDSHPASSRTTRTPNKAPLRSTAAATCTSRCVSTPPTIGREVSTMVIAIPSLVEQVKGWHARPGKETVTSRLLAQPARSPSGTGRASFRSRATYPPSTPPRWTHLVAVSILTGQSGAS